MDSLSSIPALIARLDSPAAAEAFSPLCGMPYALVALDGANAPAPAFRPNCPVIGIGDMDAIDAVPDIVDVAVASVAEAETVTEAIERNPIASMTLVGLLRHNERVSTEDALLAESLAYSTLQHGAEFQSWLASRPSRRMPPDPEPPVLIDRVNDELHITLNRPHRRNAYSSDLRDALCEALYLVADDPGIAKAILRGAGVCFSAGGDLDEFGEGVDAGRAHASRLTRSAGAALHALRDRVEARLHGACIGAGIELPAFVSRVVAQENAFFQLPEVSMGLVPGAGGTASILPRIGRRRLAYMALTGARVDAETALAWGLVDEIQTG